VFLRLQQRLVHLAHSRRQEIRSTPYHTAALLSDAPIIGEHPVTRADIAALKAHNERFQRPLLAGTYALLKREAELLSLLEPRSTNSRHESAAATRPLLLSTCGPASRDERQPHQGPARTPTVCACRAPQGGGLDALRCIARPGRNACRPGCASEFTRHE
jgi:hypothetical protein